MTKHQVPMDDFDEDRAAGGYTGQEPRRGVYTGKLVSVQDHTSSEGNEGLRWVFEITEGEFSGWRGYQYSNLDKGSTLWKTQQITYAISGSKKSIVIDTDANGAKLAKKAKPVMLRVITEKYEGEPRAKLSAVIIKLDDVDDDNSGDEDDPFA